jgi:hypothetical protein
MAQTKQTKISASCGTDVLAEKRQKPNKINISKSHVCGMLKDEGIPILNRAIRNRSS